MPSVPTINSESESSRIPYCARWILGVVFGISLLIRLVYIAPHELILGYHASEDALSHTLVTSNLIAAGNAQMLLPVFTYPGEHNLSIDNLRTAGRFAKDGRYYYTSFPPGAFIIVAGIARIFGIEWTPFSLRTFAIFLHLTVALTTAGIVREIGKKTSIGDCLSRDYAILAFMLSFTTFELARSYSFSIWGQHLIQLPLLILPWLVLRKSTGLSLYALVLVIPLIEWTGYIANVSLALVLFWNYWHQRGKKQRNGQLITVPWNAFAVLALTAVVGIIQISWFSSLLGFHEYISALAYRGEVRGTAFASLVKMPFAYIISIGATLILPVWCVYQTRHSLQSLIKPPLQIVAQYPLVVCAIALLLLPCAENLLLSNHVIQYPFDRIKGCAFFIVFIFTVLMLLNNQKIKVERLAYVTAWACAINLVIFCVYSTSVYYQYGDQGGNVLAVGSYIRKYAAKEDTVIVNDVVRGNYLYHSGRNILEASGSIPNPCDYIMNSTHGAQKVHLIFPNARTVYIRDSGGNDIRTVTF